MTSTPGRTGSALPTQRPPASAIITWTGHSCSTASSASGSDESMVRGVTFLKAFSVSLPRARPGAAGVPTNATASHRPKNRKPRRGTGPKYEVTEALMGGRFPAGWFHLVRKFHPQRIVAAGRGTVPVWTSA